MVRERSKTRLSPCSGIVPQLRPSFSKRPSPDRPKGDHIHINLNRLLQNMVYLCTGRSKYRPHYHRSVFLIKDSPANEGIPVVQQQQRYLSKYNQRIVSSAKWLRERPLRKTILR